jgi:hypothetical protein
MSRAPSTAKHLERGPGLHWRVHVAEVPLVRRKCAVRVLEPLPAQQDQLVLSERRVDVRQGHAVECQVPGGEPGILPLVRHRHDVEGVEAAPPAVPPGRAARGRRRLGRVAVQPARNVVVVELLAPEQPAERLAHHHGLIGGRAWRRQLGVELVRLASAQRDHPVEVGAERARRPGTGVVRPQPQPKLRRRARRDRHLIPERALGTAPVGVDGRGPADHVVVDAVLRVRGGRRRVEQPRHVRLVLAEQRDRRRAVRTGAGQQLQLAAERVPDAHRPVTGRRQQWLGGADIPGPGVAEPRGRQHVQGRGFRPGVGHLDRHQDVVRVGLCVVHLDDPVPVVVERTGVHELIFRLGAVAPPVHRNEVVIGEGPLRVVIAPPLPGVARQRIQVPPVFLYVLAMVALLTGQAEGPLLQDRVVLVPQGQRQAQPLLDVAEPGQAVLPPPVGAGSGVIVRQVVPGLAVRAVVLPDRAPLPLAGVGPPPVPVTGLAQPVLQVAESVHALPLSSHPPDRTGPPGPHVPSEAGLD